MAKKHFTEKSWPSLSKVKAYIDSGKSKGEKVKNFNGIFLWTNKAVYGLFDKTLVKYELDEFDEMKKRNRATATANKEQSKRRMKLVADRLKPNKKTRKKK